MGTRHDDQTLAWVERPGNREGHPLGLFRVRPQLPAREVLGRVAGIGDVYLVELRPVVFRVGVTLDTFLRDLNAGRERSRGAKDTNSRECGDRNRPLAAE